jgi:REP element-mobilizing transposase RayT
MKRDRHGYLKRLPPEHYRGQACVHWSLTIDERKTGWLVPIFYYKYREILAHTAFRFGFCCPIYCCMPDHIHLLWLGILDSCDQRSAMRFFRRQVNPVLEKLDARFQLQAYDNVITEEARDRDAFEEVADYIARNPERRGLVAADGYAGYSYTGCLVPGYPELKPFDDGYWESLWRVYSHLLKNGFTSGSNGSDGG